MRILFITQWFDPEPTFKGLPFAKRLVEMGHSVEVLTGFPNYPGGKLYNGYRVRWFQREVMDGIPVLRVPLYPSHDGSKARRVLNYMSFAFSSAVLGSLMVQKSDVAYVYHPPGTVSLPAMTLRMLRGIPFVYDIQDLWPDTLSATGMINNKRILSLVDSWTKWTYRRAAKIAVLSNGFKERLVARGVPEGKIEVIHNWCDETKVKAVPPDPHLAKELGMNGRFNVVFAGTMGKAQGLESVLEAATLLADPYPTIQFVFVGGGVQLDALRRKASEVKDSNVVFLPKRPPSEIGQVLSLADVLLVHLKDDPLFSITIPSKTQAYMAVGKPILMAVRGDAARLVQDARAGLTCLPEDPKGLAAAVAELYAMPRSQLELMGQNGQEFYARELSMEVGATRFEAMFESVCKS